MQYVTNKRKLEVGKLREKIERFSKGIFEYNTPSIELSDDELGISIVAGTTYKGSFSIKNSHSTMIKGVLYSSSKFFTLCTKKFQGTNVVIDYEIHGSKFRQGDIIKGFITIVSNCGEVKLPFIINMEAPFFDSTLGKMKDLFNFTNLAKIDMVQALKIFKQKEFPLVFLQHEAKYQALYKELIKSKSHSCAMEEFLIAIHKKLPITLTTDKNVLMYDVKNESFKDKLILTKDNWGYSEYKVSVIGDFIDLEDQVITTDNFIANNYTLEFILRPENMRNGNNYGKISLTSTYQFIAIEVICKSKKTEDNRIYQYRNTRKLEMDLTRNYLEFRMNRIQFHEYLEIGNGIIAELLAMEGVPKLRYDLMKIHLLIASEEEEIARLSLYEVNERYPNLIEMDLVAYCGYLYLKALLQKDEETISYALTTIKDIYQRESNHYILLWLILHIDKKYDRNKILKIHHMKEQYNSGCHSPILYFEAAAIYNDDPSLLIDLGPFEISVLYWSMKENYLNEKVANHCIYLASKIKNFHPVVYRLIAFIYQKYNVLDAVSVICSMLIKSHKRGVKYIYWYDLGVQNRLRITELYEYYMYSIDDQNDMLSTKASLPQAILLYFIYNSNISDKKKAYLYSYVIKRKEQLTNIYRTYLKKMEVFALKQMEARNISNHLSTIYQEFIGKEELAGEIKPLLPYVMFSYQIECKNPNIKGVFIVHDELEDGVFTPFVNGIAIVQIFTENYEIILCDYNDNRYAKTTDYTLYKLMPWEEYINFYKEDEELSPFLLLNLAEKMIRYQRFDLYSIQLRKRLLEISGLNESLRTKCLHDLIGYYYENFDGELLDYYLNQINLMYLNSSDRYKIIELYIVRGMMLKAYINIKQYGFEGIALNKLLKLTSHLIEAKNDENETIFLLQLAFYLFEEGKYNEQLLNFLIRNFNGTTNDMFVLWEIGSSHQCDVTNLEERLLCQMLFAESYLVNGVSVFLHYYKEGRNRLLIRSFISYQAYKYLMNGRVLNKELFEIMKKEVAYEENELCLLALLKYYQTEEVLSDTELQFIDYNINSFINKGIILPFFSKFNEEITLPSKVKDKYYVEYITNPNYKVKIHYRFEDSEEFIEEEMTNMYMGIFVAEFILFSGEHLQYYISEENENKEVIISESMSVFVENKTIDGDLIYNQINYMIEAYEMKDDITLLESIKSFIKQKCITEQVFKPL